MISNTDISEKGLETLIVESLIGEAGYVQGSSKDYSREHVVDLAKLREFIQATQPKSAEALQLDQECPQRTQFLHRLDAEIAKRGVIDVLRKGIKHGAVSLELFYGTPTPGNPKAVRLHADNIFSVTRQLRYSQNETKLALDLGLFINGLPVATFELKNSLTKQTVDDAVRQYKRDRSPNEPLFKFGRCMVHFAVDDNDDKLIAAEASTNYSADIVEEDTFEDMVNRIMESRKMLTNASYFAFTATPKNKTLEIFGIPGTPVDGKVPHRPFHSYTMKQAIQEGFILDVLEKYTPVNSWYRLSKTVEDDPEFDTKKASKKLRRYVESHDHAIRTKAEIMVDHFHTQVIARRKIGGRARAMIICSSIKRAIQYYEAVSAYLKDRKSPFRAIVAFSDFEQDGKKVTEASMNGFPSAKIEEYFKSMEIKGIPGKDTYRFLIVADKFQTGYDEPLLHTMYVDKVLSGIKAVQTLSRLNRAHPQKTDTFVLDFMNDADMIVRAFSDYYRTTVLSEETDPNKLHDLKAALDGYQVYRNEQIDELVRLFLEGEDRDKLDPILDACVSIYKEDLDEDGQVDFKGKAKAFTRTYQFLASVLPYTNTEWEKNSIFLDFLIPKLPAPREKDMSKGILELIDMDSYRAEKQETMKLSLPDEDAEIEPIPTSGGGYKSEPEMDALSNIIKTFNDRFGNIDWEDADRIRKVITEEIPARVKEDQAYQNAMKNSSKSAARLEHDRALEKVVIEMLSDHTELFKQFSDNPEFKKWLADTIFGVTYEEGNRMVYTGYGDF